MLKNYLLVALRTFWRNKVISLINVLGLSIGISSALVIFLIAHYDLTFDKFHKDSDRIFRVVTEGHYDGNISHMRGVPLPLTDAVKKDATGIDRMTTFFTLQEMKVSVPSSAIGSPAVFKDQKDITFASEQYFSVFDYRWLAGSPKTALNKPFNVVLTSSRAKAYFPSQRPENIVGRTIIYFDSIPMTVSGVVGDLEGNTDFIFKEFISFSSVVNNAGLKENYYPNEWGSITSSMQFWVKLSKKENAASLVNQVNQLQTRYSAESAKNKHGFRAFQLQPLEDIHLNGDYGAFDTTRDASKPILYGLLLLGLLLLLLACINFINLTTAQASQRAKEIGIRKTIGSSRWQLIGQFFSETVVITVIATSISLPLVPILLKVFADFIPPDLHFNWLQQPSLLGFLLLLVVVVAILSGFYPAIVLSRFRPIQVLKGSAAGSGGQTTRKALLRKTLTVSQFVVAQAFVIASLVVGRQIHFMVNSDLGFRQKAILYFNLPNKDTSHTKPGVLAGQLRSIPGVEKVSLGGPSPASGNTWSSGMVYKSGGKDLETSAELKIGDTNYLPLYQLRLIAGRNVEPSDTMREYIINETFAGLLGIRRPEDALNKYLYTGRNNNRIKIVGVMKDFHSHSLHQKIRPLVLSANQRQSHTIHVALRTGDAGSPSWSEDIAKIGKTFKSMYPEADFNYKFYDESIASFYKNEQNISRLLNWATGIAIFISCLGMLGLVIYTTNLRTKEIGVRKILGASASQIVTLLSKDFMGLVLIAFLIAAPLSWWGLYRWLSDYAFRTPMGWWLFLLAGLGMAFIALLTLCLQTIRAARANPVNSLRNE